ncbi:hypothetical protein F5Y18DRAFT_29604 [Xylariaceae sp. FL1019]|nr:hypothetical protein F5Y18DRAFT_29604 [Xylariaceae sp. FL1019]
MGDDYHKNSIPSSDDEHLHLTHPTDDEIVKIWTNTFTSWKDHYETLSEYSEESQYLTSVPLAENGGMTTWILVDKTLSANQRQILCSCESIFKRVLISDEEGNIEEGVIHGIASVFCADEYRGRGYATRHMREISKTLRYWQAQPGRKVIGSVLYSDIGKSFYAKLGWKPNDTNSHVEFSSIRSPKPDTARDVLEEELAALCEEDEKLIHEAMAAPIARTLNRLVILPDLDHMLWHIRKADYATKHLFGKVPHAKGAIAGQPGKRVWAIWTHRYYGRHDAELTDNVLYILRLVVEGDPSANQPRSDSKCKYSNLPEEQATSLEDVLRAAQSEAAEWHLDKVKLWDPSPCVYEAISTGTIPHTVVEREESSIASFMWYDEDENETAPIVINNEHYAWC